MKLDLPIDICEAVLRRCAEGLLLEGAAKSHVEGMQWCPQGLANVAWSAAKLSLFGSLEGYAMAAVVCAAVAKQARLRLESFKPHELSMMAWACATMHGRKKSGYNARPGGAAALTWAAEEFNVKEPRACCHTRLQRTSSTCPIHRGTPARVQLGWGRLYQPTD